VGRPDEGDAGDITIERKPLDDVAVFDVDGVLADVEHRRHFIQGRRDWRAFFAAAGEDTPLATGIELARAARDQGLDLVYLSGRPEHVREVTVDWFAQFDVPPGELLLRPERDRSPATALKLRQLRRLTRDRRVVFFVDDDAEVVDAVRSAHPALVHGECVVADWQPGGARARRVMRHAQQDAGAT
jgi:phosphoglycolate phosphatase-like HAD superfamily hydrolase